MSQNASSGRSWRVYVLETLIAAILSGAVIAFLGGMIFQRRAEQITSEVTAELERQLLAHRSQVEWKKESLSELLGPVVMQLERTRRAFQRWKARNLYLEYEIIYDGNKRWKRSRLRIKWIPRFAGIY